MDNDDRTIRDRVAQIAAAAGDCEIAHGLEDTLHQDVLRWIAGSSNDPFAKVAAREALKSLDIEFPRYTA